MYVNFNVCNSASIISWNQYCSVERNNVNKQRIPIILYTMTRNSLERDTWHSTCSSLIMYRTDLNICWNQYMLFHYYVHQVCNKASFIVDFRSRRLEVFRGPGENGNRTLLGSQMPVFVKSYWQIFKFISKNCGNYMQHSRYKHNLYGGYYEF